MDLYLGLDTSCYTTSVCAVTADGRIVGDERIILSVSAGGRGLSQSNMVYQHTRNMPLLMERLAPRLAGHTIRAIAVTSQPRRREDSYMPAFLAGLGCARSLAAVLAVPLYTISHQENHLLAVLRSRNTIPDRPFYGLHLSGGTTDLVRAVPDADGLAITRVGGTSDISAGQFIDRVGVALGLPFPAGVHLETLARQCTEHVKGSHVFCRDGELSFSGPESQAQRSIAQGDVDPARCSAWTLATVWRGLEILLDQCGASAMQQLGAAGGVMSNGFLRQKLTAYCHRHDVELLLAEDGFSADNASGAAFWAAWQERKKSV